MVLGESVEFPNKEAYDAYCTLRTEAYTAVSEQHQNAEPLLRQGLERAKSLPQESDIETIIAKIIEVRLSLSMLLSENEVNYREMETLLEEYKEFFQPIRYFHSFKVICEKQKDIQRLWDFLDECIKDTSITDRLAQWYRYQQIELFKQFKTIEVDKALDIFNGWVKLGEKLEHYGVKTEGDVIRTLKYAIPFIVQGTKGNADFLVPEPLKSAIDKEAGVKNELEAALAGDKLPAFQKASDVDQFLSKVSPFALYKMKAPVSDSNAGSESNPFVRLKASYESLESGQDDTTDVFSKARSIVSRLVNTLVLLGNDEPDFCLKRFYHIEALKLASYIPRSLSNPNEIITGMILPFFCTDYAAILQPRKVSFVDIKRFSDDYPLSPENVKGLVDFLLYYLNALPDDETNHIEGIIDTLNMSQSKNNNLIMNYLYGMLGESVSKESALLELLGAAKEKYLPVPKNRYKGLAHQSGLEDRDMFFGREDIIDEIREFVKRGKNVVLYGLRRSGKTSIKKWFRNALEEQDYPQNGAERVVIIEFGTPTENIPLIFPWMIYTNLDRAFRNAGLGEELKNAGIKIPAKEPSKAEVAQSALIKYLESLKGFFEEKPLGCCWKIVIMVDEFTEIYRSFKEKHDDDGLKAFMRYIRGMLENYPVVGIFVGREYTPDFTAACGNQFSIMEKIKVDCLAKADSEKMICGPSGLVFIEDALDRICALTANSPFFNMLFMDGLVNFMKDKKSPYVSSADIADFLNEKLGKDARFIDKSDFESLYDDDDEFGEDKVSSDDNLAVLRTIAKQGNACPREHAGRNTDQQLKSPIAIIIEKLIKRDILYVKRDVLSIKVGLFSEWLKKCEPSQIYENVKPKEQQVQTELPRNTKNTNDSTNLTKMGRDIADLIKNINSASRKGGGKSVFKDSPLNIGVELVQACDSRETFGPFIQACYAIVYGQTKSYNEDLARDVTRANLPEQFKNHDFVKIVDALRLPYGHPENPALRKSQMSEQEAREKLTESPNLWQKPEDFRQAQKKLLKMFIDYLQELNEYVRNTAMKPASLVDSSSPFVKGGSD
jgi:hypothetical protein